MPDRDDLGTPEEEHDNNRVPAIPQAGNNDNKVVENGECECENVFRYCF